MLYKYYYQDHLASGRLTTRFITEEDVVPWTEFFKEPEAIELFPTFGLNSIEERAQHWIDRQLTRYREQRYGLQMLLDTTSGEHVGQCGLLIQEADGIKELEVAYHIFKKFWGQGYAPEAAKLFLDFAFAHNLADSVISMIDIRNFKSMRVAEKNGLTREKQIRWLEMDMFIYRITRETFLTRVQPGDQS